MRIETALIQLNILCFIIKLKIHCIILYIAVKVIHIGKLMHMVTGDSAVVNDLKTVLNNATNSRNFTPQLNYNQ